MCAHIQKSSGCMKRGCFDHGVTDVCKTFAPFTHAVHAVHMPKHWSSWEVSTGFALIHSMPASSSSSDSGAATGAASDTPVAKAETRQKNEPAVHSFRDRGMIIPDHLAIKHPSTPSMRYACMGPATQHLTLAAVAKCRRLAGADRPLHPLRHLVAADGPRAG